MEAASSAEKHDYVTMTRYELIFLDWYLLSIIDRVYDLVSLNTRGITYYASYRSPVVFVLRVVANWAKYDDRSKLHWNFLCLRNGMELEILSKTLN